MSAGLTRLSKFMSLALRHRAREFGLEPDPEGFVPLAELVALVERNASLPGLGRREIIFLAEDGQPSRFEVRGELIRAAYGHSRQGVPAVVYPPVEPPAILYHGTHPAARPRIREEGLRPMSRQYVHLSTTPERARAVAGRHTRTPLILTVRAAEARAADVEFYSPEAQHFLARAVPPQFILWPLA